MNNYIAISIFSRSNHPVWYEIANVILISIE